MTITESSVSAPRGDRIAGHEPDVQCRVLRCLQAAAWRITMTDDGRVCLVGVFCGPHGALRVMGAHPGRRVMFEALAGVEAVAR